MRSRYGAAIALLAVLGVSSWAAAQAQGAKNDPKEPRSQYWIVLLDASLSSEQLDQQQSQRLGQENYRLRNEILATMQILLASLREKEQGLEDDYLDVYVFGNQTKRIEKLSGRPVQWGDIQSETWWREQVPGDIGSRTDYLEAIRRAVDRFKSQPKEVKKNLVLLSDGELDIGSINRPSRGALENEELEKYRNFLRTDNPLVKWLADNHVTVYTLALDEKLFGPNDTQRQKQLQQDFDKIQLGDITALGKAVSLINDLAGRVGPDGKLVRSEGPYVLKALAEQFGGRARSVRYDNALDVLWDTVFPNDPRRRLVLPLGTHQVIISAPIDSPVQVKVNQADGSKKVVTLRFDRDKRRHFFEPLEDERELEHVETYPTSQFVTWRISSSNLAEVLNPGLLSPEKHFSVIPINNVRFQWQTGKPPEKILAGTTVELALELEWLPQPSGPSVEEWRNALSDGPTHATAQISIPGSDPQQVDLTPEVLTDSPNKLLRLTGRFNHTRRAGTYQVLTTLEVGPTPDAWQLSARPIRFLAVAESPLAKPDRFTLAVRLQKKGKPGEPIRIAPPQEKQESPAVEVVTEPPARLVFEWWADPRKGCEGVDQLLIDLSSPERPESKILLGSSRNALQGNPVQEDGHRVCYRSTPERITEADLGRPLIVQASDGLTSWQRTLLVTAPEPLGKRILRWLLYALLALILAVALAFALLPGLRSWLRGIIDRWRADFPLAVDVAGGESRVWQPADKVKRFLVTTTDSQGDVEVEVTDRKLETGEQGFEIRPNSADDYRIRLLAGSGWNFRKIVPSRPPSAVRLLGTEGEIVSFLDLARGTRIEFEHQGTRVTVRHKDR